MLLGLLSDTHGEHRRAAYAIELLQRLGARAFIHCGDVGGEAILDQLAGRRAWFVWGNTDSPDPMLERYAEALGLRPPCISPVQIEIADRTIAVYHGHESHFRRLIRQLQRRDFAAFHKLTAGLDYIFYGHTHTAVDARVGRVRLVNPGALQRARPYTVATLDLASDALKFWHVDERADPAERPRLFRPR
ncbi:MAG: metallophosphoesterase family protein [Phycisphaerae bacterium]